MPYPIFPSLAGLGWPVVRTRMGKTLVQESTSGKETRVQLWTYPRYKWSLQFGLLRTDQSLAEFQQLLGFVNSVSGQAQPFYYTDPDDNTASGQLLGSGDGSTTLFQLARAFGGFTEPVQAPNTSGLVIYANGAVIPYGTGSGQWQFGTPYGLGGTIMFGTAPASGTTLTWSGSFYWLCRLADDNVDFSADMQGFYSVKKLEFQSIKL